MIMAVANLHIWNKYIRYNFLIVFILINDHENMYRHHFFVAVSCMRLTILNKIGVSILAILICT